MFKTAIGSAVLLGLGGYVAGVFGGDYTRTVSRPPAEVLAALQKLDLPAQPGAPGSAAEAAGGVKPLFRVAAEGNRVTWFVMSGDRVATTMTASVDPANEGKASIIHTAVERGDAPDDVVSPAFRSKSITAGLFAAAIEDRMNRLVAPPKASRATCEKVIASYAHANREQDFNRTGIGAGMRSVMVVNAMASELRRQGCPIDGEGYEGDPMTDDGPSAEMTATGPSDTSTDTAPVRFEPGKPMMDPTPTR